MSSVNFNIQVNSSSQQPFHDKKNIRKQSKKFDLPDLKRKKIEIPYHDINELINGLKKVKGQDISSRITSMGNLLFATVLESNQIKKQLWVDTANKVYLFIELTEGPFCSEAFHESAFGNFLGENHYYLSFHEGDENCEIGEPLLSLRFSKTNSIGELNSIKRGKKISGNEMVVIYEMFAKALLTGIPKSQMILYDDAHVSLMVDNDLKEMDLKLSRIWARSWYEEKLGFSVAKVDKCKLHLKLDKKDKERVIVETSQDPKEYEKALQSVQTMPLSTFYRFYKKNHSNIHTVVSICKNIFGKEYDIENSPRTIQDLQKAVSDMARLTNDNQSLKDQLFLANILFDPSTCGTSSLRGKEFIKNLYTINNSRILSKHF